MMERRVWDRQVGKGLTPCKFLKRLLSGAGLLAAALILGIGLLAGIAHIASKTPHAQAEARWQEDPDHVEALLHSEALTRHRTRLNTRVEPLATHRRESHPTAQGELTFHHVHLTYQLLPAGTGTLEGDYVLKYLSRSNKDTPVPVKIATTLEDRYVDLNSISIKRNRPHRPARAAN